MVDPQSPEWPKVQVAAVLRERIASGELTGRLPSYMALAEELKVAPMTVQRALAILKEEKIIYSVPGRGTFVSK